MLVERFTYSIRACIPSSFVNRVVLSYVVLRSRPVNEILLNIPPYLSKRKAVNKSTIARAILSDSISVLFSSLLYLLSIFRRAVVLLYVAAYCSIFKCPKHAILCRRVIFAF